MRRVIENALLFFLIATIFYILYLIELNNLNPSKGDNHVDALYNSFMVQTLVGVPEVPQSNRIRIYHIIQATIGYLLISGFVIYAIHHYTK